MTPVIQDTDDYDACYIFADDEELYHALFRKADETNLKIWQRFMKEFGDIYCVLRFGDDMGYKSSTAAFLWKVDFVDLTHCPWE